MSSSEITTNIQELTTFKKEAERKTKAENPQGFIKGLDPITRQLAMNKIISNLAFSVVGYANAQLTKNETLAQNAAEHEFIDGDNVSAISDELNEMADYDGHMEEIGFREPEQIKPSVMGGYKHMARTALQNQAMYKKYPYMSLSGAIEFLLSAEPRDNTSQLVTELDDMLKLEEEDAGLDTENLAVLEKQFESMLAENRKSSLRDNQQSILEMVRDADKCSFEEAWHELPTRNQFKILCDIALTIEKSIARLRVFAKRNVKNYQDDSAETHFGQTRIYKDVQAEINDMWRYSRDTLEECFMTGTLDMKYARFDPSKTLCKAA